MSENNVKKDESNEVLPAGEKSSAKLEKKVEKQNESMLQDTVAKKTKGGDGGEVSASIAKKKRKNIRRQVRKGRVYIKSSYNNTLVMFTDMHGNLLTWSSAGLLGFKGAKKATTYAANQVAMDAHEKIQKYGLKDIEVFVGGVGSGRDAALRALAQKGYNLIGIKDRTPVPHNGCRPKKPRRV